MAYEYITPTQPTNPNIPKEPRICRWSFALEEFLEVIKMESAYISVTIKDKDGKALVDDYAITQDEDDVAIAAILKNCKHIANVEFGKLAREPYKFVVNTTDNNKSKVVFDAYAAPEGEGSELAVEDAIREYIKEATLATWYEIKALDKFIQIYNTNKQKAQSMLHRALFGFRM